MPRLPTTLFAGARNRYENICLKSWVLQYVKFEVSTGSGLMANHFTLPLDGDIMKAEYDYADEHGLVFVIDIGKCRQ